jgi:hypothetical protein
MTENGILLLILVFAIGSWLGNIALIVIVMKSRSELYGLLQDLGTFTGDMFDAYFRKQDRI